VGTIADSFWHGKLNRIGIVRDEFASLTWTCKCGPDEHPEFPLSANIVPLLTQSPGFTFAVPAKR